MAELKNLEAQRDAMLAAAEAAQKFGAGVKKGADRAKEVQKIMEKVEAIENRITIFKEKQLPLMNKAKELANSFKKQQSELSNEYTKQSSLSKILNKQAAKFAGENKKVAIGIKVRTQLGEIDNDLSKAALDTLEQIQSGNVDLNDLSSLQLDASAAKKKKEKDVIKAINDAVKSQKAFLEGTDAINKVTKKLEEGFNKVKAALTMTAIFGALVGIATKFAHKIDEIGSSFGSLNVLGENFQDTLIAQGNSVTAIGGSLTDVASITNNLASSFGMNVDEASKLSGKVFDTGKALGISADEASNLFGVLMTVGGLTAKQTEELTEGAFQLARQAGVAPAQVMKDIAGSAETVAIFTKDGGKNLLEAAISARQLGISIDSIAKSARGVLDFEESITKEIQASVLTGVQLDLQKARQLSLSKDIMGYEQEIRNQIQSQGDFGSMNVFQQEALADAFGLSVSEVSRISKGLEDVSIKGALAGNNFENLVGRDSMSNISQLIGSFKQLGAILTDALGKGLEGSVSGLKDFLGNKANVDALKESFTSIGVTIGELITQFSEWLKNSGGIEAMASGIMGFVKGLAAAVKWMPLLIGGLVAAKGAAIAFSIASSLAALTKSAMVGGIFGVVATLAAITAGYVTLKALTPKAQGGITGFGGGNLLVGEAGRPEIVNVPRGTNVVGAEQTSQILGGGQNNVKIENALERIVSLSHVANEQRASQRIIGERGVLAIATESQRAGLSLGIA